MSNAKAMSLKAKIRNIAKSKNIPAQVILQNYMFERFLNRLSVSEYKEKFVLKGGMLVAALVGLDNRATMDLDTTLKNLPLTPDAIEKALKDIFAIDLHDDVIFSLKGYSVSSLIHSFFPSASVSSLQGANTIETTSESLSLYHRLFTNFGHP